MVEQVEFCLKPRRRGCHLVTDEVLHHLPQLPQQGLLHLFVKHTSCGLCLNENFDERVRQDLSDALDRMAPESVTLYSHDDEGPDDMPAHVKSALTGVSLTIPITGGRLNLGTWQGIYLCEYRNQGGSRRLVATIMS